MGDQGVERKLAAILAADVEGYSRLMGEDEAATVATLRAHREVTDRLIAQHDGRIANTAGDSIIAVFDSAVQAVRTAVAIQTELTPLNVELSEDRQVWFRIGVNLGDVILEGEDVLGDGVNVAARLEGLADAGGICIARSVHDQVAEKLHLGYEFLGPQQVKNIKEPVRAYRVLLTSRAKSLKEIEPAQSPKLPDKPSIAILPFDNLSGDPEQEYFSDGISEDIITGLSKISGLLVIARNSSFTFKGKSFKVQQVGRELGARYVLEGSVRRSGSRVRITAQLIDAFTDHHLWADRYDGDLEDVFALQDEVAGKVVSTLKVTLTSVEEGRLERKHTPNLDAYDLYLRARVTWSPPLEERVLNARGMLEEIVRLDPKFAGGYAGLSFTHSMAAFHHFNSASDDDLRLAFELAERSVALDDTFGFAYTALAQAHLCKKQHDEAVKFARRAVQMQPSDAYALGWLGFLLNWAGETEEAVEVLGQAKRLDPLHWVYEIWSAFAHFTAEQYDEALEASLRGKDLGHYDVHMTFAFRAAAFSRLGRDQEALATARELLKKYPDFSVSIWCPKIFPFRKPEDLQRISDSLIKAGIPQ